MPLNNGGGHMPALGFGTLILEAAVTKTATRDALEGGFRHFDCAERYRNEREVGEALRVGLAAAGIARDISALPEDALNEINRIQTRQRLNEVVKTGVPGFIAQGK
jgi:diketogulonate reductase-like aldo/keto reductase